MTFRSPPKRQGRPQGPAAAKALAEAGRLFGAGQLGAAASLCHKVLAEAPSHAGANHLLGLIAHRAGHTEDAARLLQDAARSAPREAAIWGNLGVVLLASSRRDEAEAAFATALRIKPDYADAHSNLGALLMQSERPTEAIPHFQAITRARSRDAAAFQRLGGALTAANRKTEAIEAYRHAVALAPEGRTARIHLADALAEFGEIDEALALYRELRAEDPASTAAHHAIARLAPHPRPDADTAALDGADDATPPKSEGRMLLAFARGKVLEDQKRYREALAAFAEGNAIRRSGFDYDPAETASLARKTIEAYTPGLFTRRAGTGFADETPVFILGLPRSGTSLAEQILASHPEVFGAGELYDFPQLALEMGLMTQDEYPAPEIATAPPTRFAELGRAYVDRLRRRSGAGASRITDKLPANFWLIGLIRLALPKATIIHCRRDPLDNCLSIYKTFFGEKGLRYAYDLAELGAYHRVYQDLMAYWHRTLPGAIHDLDYEALIADQEGESRKLVARCGLAWDDACLQFHKAERAVRTASAGQVHRPIYSSSVRLAERYGDALMPLLEALREH